VNAFIFHQVETGLVDTITPLVAGIADAHRAILVGELDEAGIPIHGGAQRIHEPSAAFA